MTVPNWWINLSLKKRILFGVISCFIATCRRAIAAEPAYALNAPGTVYHCALLVVTVLLGLAVALVAARWLYSWTRCRKATRAAIGAVKEGVARGQKPYC